MTKEDLLKWYDEEYCLKAIEQDPLNLQYIENQTEEICLEAVKQNPWVLQYIENQTEKICLEAIKQNKNAIDFVDIKRFPKIYEKYLSMK